MRLYLLISILLGTASICMAKSGPTVYTPEEIALVRKQAKETDWGKAALDGLLKSTAGNYSTLTVADLAQKPEQYFWDLMPSTKIPRNYYVHDRFKEAKGCPIHGKAIFEGTSGQLGGWSFNIDAHPWKLRCPVGGEYYPTNDFAAGDMTSGEFPDNGQGCQYKGDTYYFIPVYFHYLYLGNILPVLRSLSEAYQLTGDPAYGRRAAILLLKIAQEYPNATTKRDRTYHPGYGGGAGMITDCDWSPGDLNTFASVYDELYEAYADPELLAFIAGKHPELQTAGAMRAYVEDELLRAGAQACIDKVIQGNHGAREVTVTNIALALDDFSDKHPNSKDCLQWVYYAAPAQIRYMASNLLFRDGGTTESPSYSTARLDTVPLLRLVERLRKLHPDQFPEREYPLLFDNPKYRAMFSFFTDLVCIERFMPVIGDMGGDTLAKPVSPESLHYGYLGSYAADAFEQYGEAKFAQAAFYSGAVSDRAGFHTDVELNAKIKAAAEQAGPHILRKSQVLDGYKIGLLRDGEGDNQRTLWDFYGSLQAHGQNDSLQVGLFAKGLDLLPGIGYPQSWKDVGLWEAHPLTHNTVCIDREYTGGDFGRMLGFVDSSAAQWMQVEKEGVGADVSVYRRTLALVKLSDEDCYAVDIFDVKGGGEQHLSYHGPQAPTTTGGLALVSQEGGTVAGKDVAFGAAYTDAKGRSRQDPLSLMTNVQRARPRSPWWVDYAMGDKRDVHLRLHGVPEAGSEVILTDGRGPTHPEHYTVKFVLEHRQGQAPLASRFITIAEPYEKQPFIKSVSRVPIPGASAEGGPVVLRVATTRGIDYLFFNDDPSREVTLPGATGNGGFRFQGRFGLVREVAGTPTTLCLIGGRTLKAHGGGLETEPGIITGRVSVLDRRRQSVDLDQKIPAPEALIGRTIRIFRAGRTSMYTIVGAEDVGGQTRVTLDYSSLVGEGVAQSISDYVIHNPVLMFYGGLRTRADGTRNRGSSLYAGARLENEAGTVTLPVEGVTDGDYWGTPTSIYIDRDRAPEAKADHLKTVLADADGDGRAGFYLYDYGVGDSFEIMEWLASTSEAAAGG
jgi:oligo-alginate lyase